MMNDVMTKLVEQKNPLWAYPLFNTIVGIDRFQKLWRAQLYGVGSHDKQMGFEYELTKSNCLRLIKY